MKRGVGRVIATVWALALALPLAAGAAGDMRAWHERMDLLERQGYEAPDDALQALQALRPPEADVTALRAWWRTRGQIQARAGLAADAMASTDQLAAMRNDALATADAELVRATLADNAGQLDHAATLAQAALTAYEHVCGTTATPAADDARSGCDWRTRWHAHQLLALQAAANGHAAAQREHWQAAATLAQQAQDPYHEAWSLAQLGGAQALLGEFEGASRLIDQAARLARTQRSAELQARVMLSEARLQSRRGEAAAAARTAEAGLELAQHAGAQRVEALFLIDRSHEDVKAGRPQQALQAIERALPVMVRFHEARAQRMLLHDASLAKLALRQLAGAKHDFEQALALWQSSGDGEQAAAMREFGDALASAGDYEGALALYHRERQLTADIMSRNREAALRELRARYDREAQQRNIELLERDNALKGAQLKNRALQQRAWTLLAAALTAAAAFAALLYLRMRETKRRLERSRAHLHEQSRRDPLTGLANRRHLQDVMRERRAHAHLEGALLLADIDHFKRINDSHGHAAGDEVLVEVARRLSEAVRSEDVVVRWGGEEFLVFGPRMDTDAVQSMAERLLRAVCERPVVAGGQALPVTLSIGHAAFPLAPDRPMLGWERALHFVDLALYKAKSLGRHRAVGIRAVLAPDPPALQAVEDDFERAWSDGRVVLKVTEGAQGQGAG